jgi:hypothetical protein
VATPSIGVPSAPPGTAQPETKTTADEKRNVSLQVTAFPKEAAIYLDDARMTGNPVSLNVPADARQHQLRAEAAGYEPTSTVRTFDKDTEVVLTLKKREPSSTPSRKRAIAPTPAGKANCNPPYFFDENGLKTFKPECL